jgi:tRNA dimethylallyltransferase
MKKVIIVQGPTASGKTALAISLAKRLKTEVISADSRQFYKEMSIGTAKPDAFELSQVKHHFIDCASVKEEISAAKFAKMAQPVLENLLSESDFAVIAGGSGMFIDALVLGLDDIPVSESVKKQLIEEYNTYGLIPLLAELEEKDFVYYETVDRNNAARIIRALEAIRVSGKKMSELQSQVKSPKKDFDILRFSIDWPRDLLYERINKRVDIMFENGLMEEVHSLAEYRNLNALNTVGYKEVFDFIDGKTSKQDAVNLIKQHTRNYAKRQMTWLRRYSELHYLNPLMEQSLEQQAFNFLLQK